MYIRWKHWRNSPLFKQSLQRCHKISRIVMKSFNQSEKRNRATWPRRCASRSTAVISWTYGSKVELEGIYGKFLPFFLPVRDPSNEADLVRLLKLLVERLFQVHFWQKFSSNHRQTWWQGSLVRSVKPRGSFSLKSFSTVLIRLCVVSPQKVIDHQFWGCSNFVPWRCFSIPSHSISKKAFVYGIAWSGAIFLSRFCDI